MVRYTPRRVLIAIHAGAATMNDRLAGTHAVVGGDWRGLWSRRGLLQGASLCFPGFVLGDFARRAAAAGAQPRARSVLVVYAGGGISHHDAFDPKPDAPAEVRGELATIGTALPGAAFTELLPRLARDA